METVFAETSDKTLNEKKKKKPVKLHIARHIFGFLFLSFHSVIETYCVFYYITCEAAVNWTLVQIFSSFHEQALWHFRGDEYSVSVCHTWNESFCFISLLLPRGALHWLVVAHRQLERAVAASLSRVEAANRICKEQLGKRHLRNSLPQSSGHESIGSLVMWSVKKKKDECFVNL